MKKDFIFGENGFVVRDEFSEAWRKEMARFQPLDADEVRELIVRAQNGDNRARTKVINHNLRIVWSIAAKFQGMDNFMDILQNGNYGLCMAVDTFDVSRETMFTTWALMMVVKYINIGLTDESRVVRVRADLVRKIDYASVSVDAPIANDEDGEKTLLDFMASDMSADNFSEVEAMRVKINYLMRGLKDVEKAVICGLFGFGCAEETENTLSAKFGLTRERVRQIKWEALEKMAKLG
jgi:RNA polymerase sigma factor (sigma-70 family)